jgi:hypothetical protein
MDRHTDIPLHRVGEFQAMPVFANTALGRVTVPAGVS